MQFFKSNKIWLILVVLLTIISYYPAFFNSFTNWDDNLYVTDNDLIKSFGFQNIYKWFTGSHTGLYHPLTLFSFAIDYSISGENPLMFHITNLFLHLLNTLLVFKLVQSLFNNRFIAIATMFLFGIHTLHVESVAWITERKDVLYSFFFLASLTFYVIYHQRRKAGWLFLTFIFFIMSLMSKAAAVTLPVNLLIIDYLLGRNIFSKKVIIEKIPFFIMSIVFGLMTVYLHHGYGSLDNTTGLPLFIRILVSGKALMFYFTKILLPVNLSAFYPMPQIIDRSSLFVMALNLAGYLALFLGLLITYKRSRIVFAGIAFFIVNISLFLIPVGVPISQADRFVYIPSIGLFIIISYCIYLLSEKYPKIKTSGIIVFSIYILFLSGLTFQRVKTWKNSLTLWGDVINKTGQTYFPLMKRGITYRQIGNYDAAFADLNASIKLHPDNYYALESRGYIYLLREDYQNAKDDFMNMIELNPESSYAYCSLGFACRKLGDYTKALESLNIAIGLDESYADAFKNRGYVYIDLNDFKKACSDFNKALELGLPVEDETEVIEQMNRYCNNP